MTKKDAAVFKDKLEACFNRLQKLAIKSTLPNMELLTASLYDIRDMFQTLDKEEKEDAADTE